jgi:hypothetical protein
MSGWRLGVLVTALLAWTVPGLAQYRPGVILRIVLLVDSSSRVAPMLTSFRGALNALVDGLPPEAEVAFVTTGGQLRVRVAPTNDRVPLRAAINGFATDGGANAFIDTLLEADKRFLPISSGFRPVFVIVSTDSGSDRGDARVNAYNAFVHGFVGRGGRAHAVVIRESRSGLVSMVSQHLVETTSGYYEVVNLASALPKAIRTLTSYVAADQ